MAIPHASPGHAFDVRPLGHRLADGKTSALFKSVDLEVMRLVLQAGKSMPPHKVAGELTIQCLEGSLELVLDEGPVRLGAGELLFLTANAMHGVKAVTNASALITLVLKP
ncbi:cupin domain-containing protein [Variovorax sp. J22P168]|uniref:cupin domain-containing protein n=1 Tax=Variovorax jilinensis TaxID=3053513 RepID=UPI00257895FB|nr:cupin domain-containing protein [Variovorax sp. J22P168]MDM0014446.1 cupin domain-containing protein [Variovorax sp. J22P168]